MQLISKYGKGFRFLLCVVDVYSKYALILPLKDKKIITVTKAFKEILDEYRRKPNKIWVYNRSEFFNRSMKSWLQDNNMEMYSTHNEEKSVVAERFIRTLKENLQMYDFNNEECVFDKLADTANKYSNTYHRVIEMKPLKSTTYIDFNKENNKEDPKLKVHDHLKMWKYKNIFAKGSCPNWSEEIFMIKKVKNTVPWTYFISGLNGEEIVGTFST